MTPKQYDVASVTPEGDSVEFRWQDATDNGPADAIRYEIEVSRNANFLDLETTVSNIAGPSVNLDLAVSRFEKYWHVRAVDIGGNVSEWSSIASFRLVYGDDLDHGGGDAEKVCGISVPPSPGHAGALGLAALLVAVALAVRTRPF
ncbi:MAG: hypothetical protein HY716_15820 [Planctomycetes bacterium]|nr:hypothetical protein [Planctomycetota bacterium]